MKKYNWHLNPSRKGYCIDVCLNSNSLLKTTLIWSQTYIFCRLLIMWIAFSLKDSLQVHFVNAVRQLVFMIVGDTQL